MKIGKNRGTCLWVALLLILVTTLTAVVWLMVDGILKANNEAEETSAVEIAEPTEVELEVVEPEVTKIDFQPVVDAWANATSGNESVLIYDLEREEVVGEYRADESYNTASLYKLFVVYEGYRRVQNGAWQADAPAGTTGHTVLECLDLSIRESHSLCAEALWGIIGHDALDQIVASDFGATNSDISHLISNPRDILKIMQIFYEHSEITNPDLVARMQDSFLNQPSTTYNWRQGLPSGFGGAKVYNKVGWEWNGSRWNIYHDVAIVEFPEAGRHFAVVVMTNYVPFAKIRDFGAQIEQAFLTANV